MKSSRSSSESLLAKTTVHGPELRRTPVKVLMLNLRKTQPITMVPSRHQGGRTFTMSKHISRTLRFFTIFEACQSLIHGRSQGGCTAILISGFSDFPVILFLDWSFVQVFHSSLQ